MRYGTIVGNTFGNLCNPLEHTVQLLLLFDGSVVTFYAKGDSWPSS
jgi:hypothetical protein